MDVKSVREKLLKVIESPEDDLDDDFVDAVVPVEAPTDSTEAKYCNTGSGY